MEQPIWEIQYGTSPVVAAALHDGHQLRPEVEQHIALGEHERLREEDPFTGRWTALADTRIVVFRSRFEVDLNRPRDQAVYQRPDDAWGLKVWKSELPDEICRRSLSQYDAFYTTVHSLLQHLVQLHGRAVVFDLHSYNHRRAGPGGGIADPQANPQVNVGTGTMQRSQWAPLVDRCLNELRQFSWAGHRLDVRENVRFRGGQFPRWIHETFPGQVCAIAIEVKKFFMDEWTGQPDDDALEQVGRALRRTAAGVMEELERT